MNTDTLDWTDIPRSYALIADPKYKIIDVDDVMDDSVVVAIGSWNQCDKAMTEAYEAKVAAFEEAYEAHIEEMLCDY